MISARMCAASNGSAVQPSGPARPEASVPRPDSSLISPVNWPAPMLRDSARRALRPSRRMMSIAPLSTSQAERVALADVEDRLRPARISAAAPLAKRLAVSICAASSTGNICSRRFSISDIASLDSPAPPDQPSGRDPDLGTRPHFRQRLHVAQRLGEDVARARQPAFVALRDRRAAEADRDGRAFRPIGDLARRDHGAGIGLPLHPHRHVEIDLLAPGHSLRLERQRRRDRLGGRRVEQFGVERERAEIEADARHGHSLGCPSVGVQRIMAEGSWGFGALMQTSAIGLGRRRPDRLRLGDQREPPRGVAPAHRHRPRRHASCWPCCSSRCRRSRAPSARPTTSSTPSPRRAAPAPSFVFGYIGGGPLPFELKFPGNEFVLAFNALPIVLLMSVLTTLLFYWGILPPIVKGFAFALNRTHGRRRRGRAFDRRQHLRRPCRGAAVHPALSRASCRGANCSW